MRLVTVFLIAFSLNAYTQKKQCFADFKMHYEDLEFEEAAKVGANCPEVLENEETHHHLVRAYMYRKMYDQALLGYKALLKIDPTNFDYNNGLGAAYYQLDEYDSSEVYYSKAVEIDPKSDKGIYNRAMLYYVIDDLDRATKDIKQHIANHPDSPDGYALAGDIYLADSNFDEALQSYQTALKADPNNTEALAGRAQYHFAVQEFEKGIADIDAALAIKKKEAKLFFTKGDLYYFWDENHYKEALEAYKQALKLEEDGVTYYQIGSCYDYLDETKSAIANYKKAIEFDDDDPDYFSDLAYLLYTEDEYEEGLRMINKAIELEPDYDYHYTVRGYIYTDLGNHEKALKSFYNAERYNPNDAHNHLQIGLSLERLGREKEALEEYNKAYGLDQDPEILYFRGYLLASMGQYKAALADQLLAVEGDPTNTAAIYEAALNYYELGNLEKCCEYMNKAAKLGDKDAKDYLKKYCP